MNSDYVAWNGERYVWPPPDDWYLASDGRWWAPDTGPDMDLDPAAGDGGLTADAPVSQPNTADPIVAGGPHFGLGEPVPTDQPEPTQALPQTDPGIGRQPDHGQAPSTHFAPDVPADADRPRGGVEAVPASTTNFSSPAPGNLRGPDVDPTLAYEPVPQYPGLSEPETTRGRQATGQHAAVPTVGSEPQTAQPTDGLNSTMVMTESSRVRTGQHTAVTAEPDDLVDDRTSILEPSDPPSAQVPRSRTMPMVAAGLLVAAALVIAGLLSLLGGDDDTQTQQPSASADEPGDTSGELVVSTDDDATTPTSADDDAMADGDNMSEDDDAMSDDDDAMADEDQESTSTTSGDGSDTTIGGTDATLIGQFRTLLEDNQITAAALTGDDLDVFGQTACSYATSAGDLPEYEQIRNDALNGAENDELSIEELRFVVDAAVTVFCAEDATRLGLEATAPAETG